MDMPNTYVVNGDWALRSFVILKRRFESYNINVEVFSYRTVSTRTGIKKY